ncbi:MAG: CTP synthase, partial [Armatimonadetes bacterium]|nr:CTP synthase [Armatimonadota bacterium]
VGDSLSIHVTLVPAVGPQQEVKTKPTQHSVRELRNVGIHCDVLLARTAYELNDEQRQKIALFCDLPDEAVITARDVGEIYQIPLLLEALGLGELVCRRLGLSDEPPDLADWEALWTRCQSRQGKVRIGMVGKYIENGVDTYLSICEALKHAGIANGVALDTEYVNAGQLSPDEMPAALAGMDAVLVPGGFGDRGIESKIAGIRYAREHKVPFLGLCLGLQCAVIEFARNVCGLHGAHSTEFDEDTPHPVVAMMDEQRRIVRKGGTMRLGAYECYLQPETLARSCYGQDVIYERHRHRFEVNNQYRSQLGQAGLRFCGQSPTGQLVEMIELPDHPFFLATQFHPEFRSRPTNAHPLFRRFVAAACAKAGVEVRGGGD